MTPDRFTTARIGRVQRQVLLCLSDGEERSAPRIDMDMLLESGAAYGALRGLWKRGLVDRAFSYNEMEWHLTRAGSALTAELFPNGEDDES